LRDLAQSSSRLWVAVAIALIATPRSRAGAQASPPSAARPLVSVAEYNRWKTEFSNWGRWGPADQAGTLNLITPAKRKEAAALVKEGVTISLAVDVNEVKSADNPTPYERVVTSVGPVYAMDSLAVSYHGTAHTHIDALSHRVFDGKIYNGAAAAEAVTREDGAKKSSIYTAHAGIVTRGVLMDIPALKGVPYLEPGTRIFAEDLDAWERKAGVNVEPGDALFIRTGRWVRAKTGLTANSDTSGLDASVIPWLKRRDIAVVASEYALDARPSSAQPGLGVHDFALAYLGIHVIDNCDLTALAEAASARKRWSFQFVAAPLPIRAGTGSPINPIAIF
jgi:kynurenine formamidase